mgnify:CR=1 FL=1
MGLQDAAIVARRYYLDDKTKLEIAEELGISRFKVARLLDEAKARGLVRIQVEMPAELDLSLAAELVRRTGIARAVVTRSLPESESNLAALGTAAADVVARSLTTGDALGISWGASVSAVVDAMTTVPRVDVVQLVGGLRASDRHISGDELVRQLAARSGGQAYTLHAPLVVRTREMADELRSDPSLAETIDHFDDLAVALVGIGAWPSHGSSLESAFGPQERRELLAAGATADICGRILNDDGIAIATSAAERTVGITIEELRTVPEVVAVAHGQDKVQAIRTALASGLVKTLVTDSDTAEGLLA